MKRIISLFLCAVFVALSLVGCSKGKTESSSQSEGTDYSKMITIDSHYSDINDDAIASYKRLCEAVIKYEPFVKVNTIEIENINRLFYTSFPLYSLVSGINFSEDKTGLVISYTLTQQEHEKKVSQFFSSIDKIRASCGHASVTKDEFIKNLYQYICDNFSIDNSVTTVFDCALSQKGMSSSLSGLFEYILLLEGIDASHIIKTDNNGNTSMLTLAVYSNEECLFDVASEITKGDKKEHKYFAVDTKKAIKDSVSLTYTDGSQLFVP